MGGINSRYNLIIPVFKNEDGIADLVARCISMTANLRDIEFIFVVDGSPDKSWINLRDQLSKTFLSYKLINLSRNFGAINAVRYGFLNSDADITCVMSADLQEPVELIYSLFEALGDGKFEIAIGRRLSRKDRHRDVMLAKLSWIIYRFFINADIPKGGIDIFACTRKVVQNINLLKEQNTSLVGLLYWIGFERTYIDYDRIERIHGESSWYFSKKVSYFLDSTYSFTDLPLRALQAIGFVGIGLSLMIGLSTFVGFVTNNIKVPGYTTLAILLTFSVSMILTAIGILGAYVWRTFGNSQRRPFAIANDFILQPKKD
jgi:glycosyltransferase involved in cell wall biosynthesis